MGDRWSALVLVALSSEQPARYNELLRRVEGVSQRMLTLTLKGLQQDGLVTRSQFPTIPPRVEYCLTDRGVSLLTALRPLLVWAESHEAVVAGAGEAAAEIP